MALVALGSCLTKDEFDELFFKLEFDLPVANPELDALRARLHLSQNAVRLLAQFQTPPRMN